MKKFTPHSLLYMRILTPETQREKLSGFAQSQTATALDLKASSLSIVAYGH